MLSRYLPIVAGLFNLGGMIIIFDLAALTVNLLALNH